MTNIPQGFTPRKREIDEQNPFVLKETSYVRDIYPVKHYLDQQAWHLHLQTGRPYDYCRTWLIKKFAEKRFEGVRNPTVRYLRRMENGDRAPDTISLTKYIEEVIADDEILAPTMTTYIATAKYESVLAGYIMMNIKKRSTAKKAMFAAKMAGDSVEEFFQDLEQRNTKLSNNSISGAHASASTPLYNQTNHSTLTSNCRMTSGSGNANNEKLLSGNRHYWAPYIVFANIVSITQNTEYDMLEQVMQKYQLHYPTVDEVMQAIAFSTDLYWKGNSDTLRIRQLVMSLTAIQRAAFLYTGDMHHLRMYNSDFMHRFIDELSKKTYGEVPAPHKLLHKLPEDYVNLAHQICEKEWAGEGKKYDDMFEAGKKDKLDVLLATASNTYNTVHKYADFIRVIFVSENVPASVPYFPQSIRRAALTSDTDSTIFTTQDWVRWFYGGNMVFGEQGSRIASTMIFLAAQAIVHILARMSINSGVDVKHIWRIAMKNEFYFPVFSPTEVAKHYWALRGTQEGNVFAKPEMEIKGVHLKSSNAPKEIIEKAQAMMQKICEDTYDGKNIVLHDLLSQVANIEREVLGCFKKADPRFCRRGEIKSKDSYAKSETESNFLHHLFWKEVFAPKYGFNEEPPYAVVRLSGSHKTPTDTQEWLERLDKTHPDTARRVRDWMRKYNKKKMGSFMIPKQFTDANGVPDELLDAINVRKLTADITSIFYLLLKNVGYYGMDKKLHMLISDRY